LLEFPGALVLVTHDRWLLDRVSTVLLALDGRGNAQWYADYAQWETAQARKTSAEPPPDSGSRKGSPTASREASPALTRKGLTYREHKEWDTIEQRIVQAEAAVTACQAAAGDPAIVTDAEALRTRYAALETAQTAVDQLYARWAELEAKRAWSLNAPQG
jgi:ATP-binding cassette subfamily F protein uup